jgi:hypothetical protein
LREDKIERYNEMWKDIENHLTWVLK